MPKEIVKLLDALPKHPNFMVMHFAKDSRYIKDIEKFCLDGDFSQEYKILTFSNEAENKLKGYENDLIKVQFANLKRPRFSMQGKFYDYLFVLDLPENLEEFFKKVYLSLKNGAPSFIFLDSYNKDLAYKVELILIECNFVATSIMEIDEFFVVSARKMHGWGG